MLLGKIDDSKNQRVSYVYDEFMFHYLVHDGIIFLCLTNVDSNENVRKPYMFLEEIKSEFIATYGERAKVKLIYLILEI